MSESMTVPRLIRRWAKTQPQKPALIVNGETVTYGDLWGRIAAAAEALSARGIGEGTHVLNMAVPGVPYVVALYAVLGLGAVHIPVENKAPAERIREIAAAVDAEYVLAPEDPQGHVPWVDPASLAGLRDGNREWMPVGESRACSEIIFTTGTTGKSKGVMLSSHNLMAYIPTMQPAFRLDTESVFLVTTPLNHVGGLHRIHQCMAAGSAVVLMDGVRDLRGFFAAAHTCGVTHTYLPPASVKLILTLARKELAKLDGRLKLVFTASAPFPTADIEKLIATLPNTPLYQAYGSSETGSVCSNCYNAPGETVSSLGRPYPHVEVHLLDEEGREVTEPGKEGRIIVKSEMCMLGYYKEPELTAQVLKDGFIHSSDLMTFDEKGGLHFAGRGDDVINVKGFKVAPVEVENLALKHPDISDCAAIPFDDPYQGRLVKLLVKLNPGRALDAEGIAAFLAQGLEPYKVPKAVEAVDEIIKTPNGKLNRREMIRLYSNIQK